MASSGPPACGPISHADTHGIPSAVDTSGGGASADLMYAEPGVRSTTFVGVGEGYHLYMKPHGEVYDVRPELSVSANGHICPLPVPRIN